LGRNALLFLPGGYSVDVPVGFYTEVMGLGASPDATRIAGNMQADANHDHNNGTTTFWRAAEGLSAAPADATMQWAVSQAVSLRRMHVRGELVLHQHHGWASGGWMSDLLVDGNVDSGSQQQWISRNCDWKSWTGSNWNMVLVGVVRRPDGAWPSPPYTTVAQTPVVREKPFLQVNAAGEFSVRVPDLRTDSIGITWRGGETAGETIPIERFYIARPDVDTAETINAQLAQGKDLILTPGIYELTAPIRVTQPDTVVLGLGFATLRPVNGTVALTTADADGIKIAGLLFDAGPSESPVLLEVGPEGSRERHAKDPITQHDVFFRVGSAGVGRAKVNFERQQQRHTGGPYVDLESGPRRRSWLGSEYQQQRASSEWKRRHDLWPVCRAPPEIPGSVERQRREDLFLSVRDSLRSSQPGELYECAGGEWLGPRTRWGMESRVTRRGR
jgi:hypothetical protein